LRYCERFEKRSLENLGEKTKGGSLELRYSRLGEKPCLTDSEDTRGTYGKRVSDGTRIYLRKKEGRDWMLFSGRLGDLLLGTRKKIP